MNGILDPSKDWPSPTVPGQCQSMLAWQWLLHRDGDVDHNLEAADSWWSRLVPLHAVLLNPGLPIHSVCLFAGRWGCIVADLSPMPDGTWAWKVERSSVHVMKGL